METFLLEIGAEEIPAGYIAPALKSLSTTLTKRLADARIAHGTVRTYGTPRRLAIAIDAMAPRQTTLKSDLVGPPVSVGFDADGAPTIAAQKFAEKAGVPVARLKRTATAKGEYLSAHVVEKGRATRTVLSELLPDVILRTAFPKSMRWGTLDVAFARPIQSLLALLGERVVAFRIGDVASGRYTLGHRFMAPGRVRIDAPDQYVSALEKAHVVVDMDVRHQMVADQVAAAAQSAGGAVIDDPELTAIVANLVETPVPTVGRFDAEFLECPPEVLITAMREHQKYFAINDAQGQLMPAFIAVNNTRVRDLDLVAAGHERVLRARLSDAQFFFRADLETPADDRIQKLSGVLFQAKLGSILDKCVRLEALAERLGRAVGGDDAFVDGLTRAARLCKSDLVSQVVVEFPKLQGVMGRVYAQRAGESGDVPVAIEEHYRPVRSGGQLPTTQTGALLSIADKMDSIAGCFSIGLVPTGAADPYALRRQAIGILGIIRDQKMAVPLSEIIDWALAPYSDLATVPLDEAAASVADFFQQRLTGLMVDDGLARDTVAAVLAADADHLPRAWQRAAALDRLRAAADFEPLAVAFKRVANIIKKAGETVSADAMPDAQRFEDPVESELADACGKLQTVVAACLDKADFDGVFTALAGIRPTVDRFFDAVMVMAEDPAVRANRLALLAQLNGLFAQVADFSKLST